MIAGPGFDQARTLTEVVSLVDLVPTLLDGAGVALSEGLRGRNEEHCGHSTGGGA